MSKQTSKTPNSDSTPNNQSASSIQGVQPSLFDDGAGVGSPESKRPEAASAGVLDRRTGIDRRDLQPEDAVGFERRRGPGRRLSDQLRSAEEGQFTKEQFLFVMAVDAFKKANHVAFPTWTDVLEIIRLLGYRKTMPMSIEMTQAEDWQESPLAPANVRSPRWGRHAKVNTQRDQDTQDRSAA